MTVAREQRFTAANPCVICGGWDRMARGRGTRCNGFLSSDGKYAHCSREEFAGGLEIDSAETYAHRLEGACKCGQTHGAAPPPSKNGKGGSRTLTQADFDRCLVPYPCDYRDEAGAVLYRVCRWPARDARKVYGYAHRNGSGEWHSTIGSAKRVALDLPELRQAIAAGRDVLLPEGEKKVALLKALGFCASTNDGGALHFKPEHAECFRGAQRIVVVLDNDKNGRERGEYVPPMLHAVGVTEVRALLLPGLAEGQGVDDWIAARRQAGATDPEIRAELEALAEAAPIWEAGEADTLDPPRLTDAGNAVRFVRQHGADLRHVTTWGRWLVWSGPRWTADATGEVLRRAKQTAASIYTEAASAPTERERHDLARHAMRSESEHAIRAMIVLAAPELAVSPDQLDADPWALNVANGTLDLRTGVLRPHRREDLNTKLAPVPYGPDSRHPVWDAFLERIVRDAEIRAFLQRDVGYSLTGDTREEKLTFVWGPEASGKSTLTEAVKSALGDYAATADFETFLRKRGDAGTRNDIARLAGVRMVLSQEVDEGRALAEGMVKTLTGGDVIAARFLYHEHFEFKPAFKLWLVANTKPRARADDGALWRRILLVPFEQTIPEPERDPEVKRILVNDPDAQAAVLAWAVTGCLAWQRERLGVPQTIRDATRAYRAENDDTAAFVTDLEPGSISAKVLREKYEAWCKENGERPVSGKRLAAAMRDRGAEPFKAPAGGGRWWSVPEPGGGDYGTTALTAAESKSPSRARGGKVLDSAAVSAVPPYGEAADGPTDAERVAREFEAES